MGELSKEWIGHVYAVQGILAGAKLLLDEHLDSAVDLPSPLLEAVLNAEHCIDAATEKLLALGERIDVGLHPRRPCKEASHG